MYGHTFTQLSLICAQVFTVTEGDSPRTKLQQALNGIRHPPKSTELSSMSEASSSGPFSCGSGLPSAVESDESKELYSNCFELAAFMPKERTSSQTTTYASSEAGDCALVPNVNPKGGISGMTPAARMGYRAPHRSGFCPPAKRRRPNEPTETPCTSSGSADEGTHTVKNGVLFHWFKHSTQGGLQWFPW